MNKRINKSNSWLSLFYKDLLDSLGVSVVGLLLVSHQYGGDAGGFHFSVNCPFIAVRFSVLKAERLLRIKAALS